MSIKRYDEIMEEAEANFLARQDKVTDINEGSVIHTILDTVARIAEREYVAIRQGYNEMLAILPYSPFKFEKKAGCYSTGSVIFKRLSMLTTESLIPKGTIVSGNGLKFETTEDATIKANELESEAVGITAKEIGSDYNLDAGTISVIESNIPVDVKQVVQTNPTVNGVDEESEQEFQERFKIYANGLSGTNLYAIKNAALSVNGVKNIQTIEHNPPVDNIINLSIYIDDGSGSVSSDILTQVESAIKGDGSSTNPGHLAPGINIEVKTPNVIKTDFDIEVKYYYIDTDTAEKDVTELVTEYVNSKAIGESLILTDLITKIRDLTYIKDVTINTPTENIPIANNEVIKVGALTVTAHEFEG